MFSISKKSIYSLIKNNRFQFALLVAFNLCFLLLVIRSGTIKYEVSDDFLMEILVSGAYTGDSSPYIMFMSPIIGEALSFLYAVIPGMNWYMFFQLFFIVVSLSTIDWVILIYGKQYKYMIAVLYTLFFGLDFMQLMQFTKTSILCITAGIFLIYLYIRSGSKKELILAIGFVLVGTMIRRICLLMSLLFIIPIFFYILILHRDKKSIYFKRIAACIGFLFCIYFGVSGISTLYSNTHLDYKQYTRFNEIRAEILDYRTPVYSEISDDLENIHVSENDYLMLKQWNFSDSDFFSYKKLKKIHKIIEEYRKSHSISMDEINEQLGNRNYYDYVPLAITILLFIMTFRFDWKSITISSLLIFLTIGVIYYFQIVGRLVYRVEFSIFFELASSFILIWLITDKKKVMPAKTVEETLIILLIVLCRVYYLIPAFDENKFTTMYFSSINDKQKYKLSFRYNRNENLKKFIIKNSNNIYLMDFSTSIQTYYLTFDVITPIDSQLFSNVKYLGGVDTNHPAVKQYLEKKSLENTTKALLNKNVYLIDNSTQEVVLTYLKNHYNPNLELKFIDTIDGYSIWKIK